MIALRLYRDGRMLLLALLVLAVTGISAFVSLPRQEDPRLRPRMAMVLTRYTGADASRVESQVTEPLEEQIRKIGEIKHVTSVSLAGLSSIMVELEEHVTDVDTVWAKVRGRIDDAAPDLPEAASTPSFDDQRGAASYSMVAGLVWTGAGEAPWPILRRLARELQSRLRNVAGTEYVAVFGEPREEIRVELDPARLASLGLTAEGVAAILARADAKNPAGALRSDGGRALVEVGGEIDSLTRLGRVPLPAGGWRAVRLGEVATIRREVVDPARELVRIGGRPGVSVAARLRGGGRIERWSAAAREVLGELRDELPPGIALELVFDQNEYTTGRMDLLAQNLLLGLGIVFLVVSTMMGLQAALLVSVALPLSLALVLFGLRALGHELHQMSITGLIIALGLMIDNAIVMVDEIARRRRAGLDAAAAIRETLGHLLVPLLGSTLTTVLAFLPIVLLHGNIGEFIGTIGLSVVFSLLASLLVSTTVIPALVGRFGPSPAQVEDDAFYARGFTNPELCTRYDAFLRYLLTHPRRGLALSLLLPALGFLLMPTLEQQFFPPADRDQFVVKLWLPADVPLARTAAAVRKVEAVLDATPGVAGHFWHLGTTGPSVYYNMVMNVDDTPSYAQGVVRAASYDDALVLVPRLQRALDAALPEAEVVVEQLGQGPPIQAPIEVRLLGPTPAVLRQLGERVRLALHRTDGVTHTRATMEGGSPKLRLDLDEDRARAVGLDPAVIARQLATNLEGIDGGSLVEGPEEIPVRVRVEDAGRREVSRITGAVLVTPQGSWLPADALGESTLVPELATLPRRNGVRVNEVRAYLAAGELPKEVLRRFKVQLGEVGLDLPAGYRMELGGDEQAQAEAMEALLAYMGVLASLMVAILVLSFGSFRLALLLATLGVASIGLAALAVKLAGLPWGFVASIGTAGLIGVSLNDSIVVLAALMDDPDAARGDLDAMVREVAGCTRHVLSTTFTTMGGFLPLLMGAGGFWTPLAAVMVLGVAGATLIALAYIPAASLLLRFGWRARAAPGGAVVET